MLPIPTRAAIAAFVGCVVTLVVAVLVRSGSAAVLGGAGLVALATAFAATMPLGRRVRHQRLEFAWWLEHSGGSAGGAVIPGAPFEVRCYVRHRDRRSLLATGVRPVVPANGRVVDAQPCALLLQGHSRTEFLFRLVAPSAGRVVLHGLALMLRGPVGLFEVPLYFPNPLAIKVLPRAATRTRGGAQVVSGLPVERSGRTTLRRRGGGTELYELRELQPGDPFNSIAWKASARFGRLMVKEVEREVQETRWIILDVSGSMRGGDPGARKLDFAIEAAAAEARRAIMEGDRVGLVTVDGRILSHVSPGDGAPQMPRVYDALLEATEVVDEDLTDADDEEVAAIVGRYVRHQDGVDFSTRGPPGWDVPGLVKHLAAALGKDGRGAQVRASNPAAAALRRFCRLRGIPLPYRPDPRDGSKGPGLASALRLAGGTSRSPSSIVVVTDFDAVTETDALLSAVKLVRSHGHRVAFVVPDALSFATEPEEPLSRELYRIYARNEERRLREARMLIGRLGVPVLVATARQPAGVAVARAQMLQRTA